MASVRIPDVMSLVSSITPSSLSDFFSNDYADTKIYRIRVPLSNERIVLSNPPPADLVDAQQGA